MQRLYRIGNRHYLHEPAVDQGLRAMLAYPPNAEETKTWPVGWFQNERLDSL